MKEIIISTANNQIRAAVLEDSRLIEVLDDTEREARLAGGIYKGKVHNVVPGIQAAFVDIGLSKNAFLYAGDVAPVTYQDGEKVVPKITPTIENLLKEGQEVVVQIVREPVDQKGARVTTHLTLPGRFMVWLPENSGYVGISRKIEDQAERERLLTMAMKLKPVEAGLIIRTLAQGVSENEFSEDIEQLRILNQEIKSKIEAHNGRGLIYTSNDPMARLLREGIDDTIDKVVIDDPKLADCLREKLKEVGCRAADKVWVDMKGKLFERYQLDTAIRNALQPRVTLPSGGYLVIEKTEALTAIDVNSGKYIGKNCLQDTLSQLNFEAAAEICRQIRLRNISGMILLDFIDMERREDWETLISCLEACFQQDKVKCKVVGKTQLGLVEVTRKKEGQSLAARYTIPCPQCGGKGWLIGEK